MIDDPQALLRVLCGLWFLPHAALKLINADKAQGTFAEVGLRPGWLFLYATVAMELAAAAALVLNVHAAIGALLGAFVLVGATYAVLRMNGWAWRWNRQGVEYTLFWAIACLISVA